MSDLPEFFQVKQRFPRPQLKSIPNRVTEQLSAIGMANRVKPNQTVAITVGSRGIANIAAITKAAVDFCHNLRAKPFLVPAMGSHGGATADGQREVLQRYGITESTMGCPIHSHMETVQVCQAAEGFPVHIDAVASSADHVLVVNRIKSHTRFAGQIESGLMKMMLIGLGKHKGAAVYHRAIQNYSFDQIVRSVARIVIDQCRVVGGLAILENGYEETADIIGVEPQEIESREPELLRRVREISPKLPFDSAELLIVDAIGKDISGAGMDTNIIGRKYNDHAATGDELPKIHHIYIRDLTPGTHGNATGLGIAEFCHQRILDQMDTAATRVNCLTAGHVTAAMIPLPFASDREALLAAVSVAGLTAPADVSAMWIRDTLHLEEIRCSRVFWDAAQSRQDLEILTPPSPIVFDADGQLAG